MAAKAYPDWNTQAGLRGGLPVVRSIRARSASSQSASLSRNVGQYARATYYLLAALYDSPARKRAAARITFPDPWPLT